MATPGRRSGRARRRPERARPGPRRWSPRSPRPGPRRWPPGRAWSSAGVGVPGLYDPAAGTTRFLVNVPGAWAGPPGRRPGRRAARRARCSSSTTRGRSGSRSSGSARVAAPASMVGLTLGTGVGGVIAVDGRVHQGHDGTAGELGPPDDRPRRAAVRLRQPRLPRGVRARRPDRGGVRHGDRRGGGGPRAGRRSRGRSRGWRRIGRYLGIGIANMIVVLSPGPGRHRRRRGRGGRPAVRADPRRARRRGCGRRRSTPSTLVPAELGIWAGAIGAAVHGAERAAAAVAAVPS